ncbi:hypothetical protein KP509_14G096800 [Ceratopteris richardii]|nr:hypothetical protein KP509_14G096800 [Ceratopteris richardii]
MLEFPGQFVSLVPNMDSISAGASGPRVAALPADKELEPSQLYLLLHMSRLNSRFSLCEMHSFKSLKPSQKASGGQTFRHPIPGSKVVPVADDNYPESTGEALAEPALHLKSPPFNESGDRNTAESADYVPKYLAQYSYLRKPKSWMPALETVDEEGLQR